MRDKTAARPFFLGPPFDDNSYYHRYAHVRLDREPHYDGAIIAV